MSRESSYVMIPFEQALETVVNSVQPLPSMRLPITQVAGLVLAEDVFASENLPPFRAATMDGFALLASDGTQARRLVGEQMAGYLADVHVHPGTAVRITTGAPVPDGADAVVMVEATDEREGQVSLRQPVAKGDNIRPIGSDIAAGQRILPAGTRLRAAEIGLLATVGQAEISVYPRSRFAVLSTGNELVEPGEQPAPGQIRDANRYALMAAIAQAGGEPVSLGIARDQPGLLEERLLHGLETADAVVTSGGVSMGELDLLKPLLEAHGTVHFGRVMMRPGKPLTFATIKGKPVFAVPGNPVSALVSFALFAVPALRKLAGRSDLFQARVHATLTRDVQSEKSRLDFQRAILTRQNDQWLATTTGSQSSSRLLSMVGANALLMLPAGREDFKAGEAVEALLLD